MIWLKLAGNVVSWAPWVWHNREELGPILQKLGDAGAVGGNMLANPLAAVRRVGNLLLCQDSQKQDRILAFIEQTTPQLDHIEQAVNGVQSGLATMSASLGHLQTLSMVTLGFSAFTSAVLVGQMGALGRRLRELQSQIAGLHKKFAAAMFAELETGLDFLRQGQDLLEKNDQPPAHDRFNAALSKCAHSMNYFHKLLATELAEKKINRDEVRILTRHLTIAVMAVASCQIGLKQDQHAFAQSRQELDLLRQATRWLFDGTVGRDPAPYLLPAMREHGVTIEVMTELYQQARDAGAYDAAHDASAGAWFEQHREMIFRTKAPLIRGKAWYLTLRTQLREAMATVEETNRVIGLARLVDEVQASGRSVWEVTNDLKRRAGSVDLDGCQHAVWRIP